MTNRIGIFGGSFDPVHIGHLIIASDLCDRLELDRVHFVLAPRPPHKTTLWASDDDRRAMLERAVADDPRFTPDYREFGRSGPSWSVETVASFAEEFPNAERFFIMGQDSLADFHTWREPHRFLSLARLAVAARPGASIAGDLIERFTPDERARIHPFETPMMEISSTMIRERLAAGFSIRYLVPPAVEAFIVAGKPYPTGPLVDT